MLQKAVGTPLLIGLLRLVPDLTHIVEDRRRRRPNVYNVFPRGCDPALLDAVLPYEVGLDEYVDDAHAYFAWRRSRRATRVEPPLRTDLLFRERLQKAIDARYPDGVPLPPRVRPTAAPAVVGSAAPDPAAVPGPGSADAAAEPDAPAAGLPVQVFARKSDPIAALGLRADPPLDPAPGLTAAPRATPDRGPALRSDAPEAGPPPAPDPTAPGPAAPLHCQCPCHRRAVRGGLRPAPPRHPAPLPKALAMQSCVVA